MLHCTAGQLYVPPPFALHLAILLFLSCGLLTGIVFDTYVHIIPLYIWDTYSLLVTRCRMRICLESVQGVLMIRSSQSFDSVYTSSDHFREKNVSYNFTAILFSLSWPSGHTSSGLART